MALYRNATFCAHSLGSTHSLIARGIRHASTAGPAEIYDVVCVGGGPAGLSLLSALKSNSLTSSLKTALIDPRPLSHSPSPLLPPGQFSNRASSLTSSSKSFLSSINAWPKLDQTRIQPYYGMQVWDGVSGARIEFDWLSAGLENKADDPVAYMVENDNIVNALLSTLADQNTSDTQIVQSKVDSISLGPPPFPQNNTQDAGLNLSSWPHIALSTGQTLAARLLIGADGLHSPVRSFAGIPSSGWGYNRHGLVATLSLSSIPDYSIAYQRFLPTGPIALLPLPGPYATLVWSTIPSNAAHLKSLSEVDFLAMVNSAFRLFPTDLSYMHSVSSGQAQELSWRLEHTPQLAEGSEVPLPVSGVQEGSIASFPLRLRHADTYATHRVALVGDAAHTIHPLAGQGLNMGLGDIECLSKILQNAVAHGQDIGDQLTLETYNAERYEQNHRLLGVVDKLHKIYSWGGGPVVGLRSWGLQAVDRIPALKGFLMGQAAG